MNELFRMDAAKLIAPPDDRRTFQRYALNMLAFVRLSAMPTLVPSLGDTIIAATPDLYELQAVSVKDLSMTGMFFYSPRGYPLEAEMEVRLCLDGTEFETAAVIQRRLRVSNQLCGFGVSFRQSQTTKELRVALAAFLLRHDCRLNRATIG